MGLEITMTDYQIQNSSRRCAATGRELKAGERYFTVLIDDGGKLIRQDFSQEGWPGPPRGAFSYWQGRLSPSAPRRAPLDEETLVECFHRLEGDDAPDRARFRFVLALLLLRRKRLRLEGTQQVGGQEVLLLRCPRTGAQCAVPDPKLSDDELEAVQDEVFDVLGWQ